MRPRGLIRIAACVGGCLAGTAFAGLPWADANSHTPRASVAQRGRLCVRYDVDEQPGCLGLGPRGAPGARGARGAGGLRGGTGPTGTVGPLGAAGLQGVAGAQGIQGIQGVQGPPGAYVNDPSGHTLIRIGEQIGPIPSPATGTELTPSVARCPLSGPDQEAYDGGAVITTADPNFPGLPTHDVVGLESSYPGLYAGPTEVDPLPLGSHPGAVSSQVANAYEAQAVVGDVQNGDNVTVQAYVVCGP